MKVHIQSAPYRLGFELTFYDQQGGKTFIYNPLTRECVEQPEGTAVAPEMTLYIPDKLTLNNLVAMLQDFGAESPSKSFTEGELKATKDHLEDMRTLVFSRKKNQINDERKSRRNSN